MAPAEPSALALDSPASSPGTEVTPTLSVSGVTLGDTVKVYSTPLCNAPSLVGSDVAVADPALITLSSLSDGNYTFYATTENSNGVSDCSLASVSYRLDTTPPDSPTVIVNSGDTVTGDPSLSVSLSAGGSPSEMCVAQNNNCAGCSYEAYGTSKSVNVSGAGTKYVSAKFKDALGNESSCVNDSIRYDEIAVVKKYAQATDKWGDYTDSTDSAACLGTENSYDNCLHAGAYRKVITQETSCAGLSMTDSRSWMDWSCAVSGGFAVFSGRLKDAISLNDLIDWSDPAHPAFKTNHVILTGGASSPLSSASAVWWSNTVAVPTVDTTNAVNLNTAFTVYAIADDTSSAGYRLTANNTSLVVKSGKALSFSATAAANSIAGGYSAGTSSRVLLAAAGTRFHWVEGDFNAQIAATDTVGLGFGSVNFVVVKNTSVRGALNGFALDLLGVKASLVDGLTLTGNAYATNYPFRVYSVTGATIKNVEIGSNTGGGVYLFNDTNVRFDTLKVHDNTTAASVAAVWLSNCTTVSFDKVSIYGFNANATSNAIVSITAGTGVTFSNFRITKSTGLALMIGNPTTAFKAYNGVIDDINGHGLWILASSRSAFSQITLSNISGSAISTGMSNNPALRQINFTAITLANNNTGTNVVSYEFLNTYHNLLALNNGTGNFAASSNAFSPTYSQIASYNGAITLNDTRGASTGNWLIDATAKCATSGGGTNSAFTNTCGNSGGAGGNMVTSNATLTTGANMTNSVKGKVTSDDATNASDNNGVQAVGSISDWLGFDHFFRAWGRDGSAFPNADHRGLCGAGNCRIWDWSLAALDSVVRNRSGSPASENSSNDGAGGYLFPLPGDACPSEVNGNVTLQSQNMCTVVAQTTSAGCTGAGGTWIAGSTYLKNAIEDLSSTDPDNDGDGLCEQNEDCIYTPNFGSYQGHGNLVNCDFSPNGGLSGISIKGYVSNGR